MPRESAAPAERAKASQTTCFNGALLEGWDVSMVICILQETRKHSAGDALASHRNSSPVHLQNPARPTCQANATSLSALHAHHKLSESCWQDAQSLSKDKPVDKLNVIINLSTENANACKLSSLRVQHKSTNPHRHWNDLSYWFKKTNRACPQRTANLIYYY